MILQKWQHVAIYHWTTKADFFHGDKISSTMIQNSLVWIFFFCFRNKPTKLIKFCMGFYFADFNPEWIFLLLQYIGISTHIFLVSVWNVCFRKDKKSVNCFLFLFRVISNLRGVTIILWQLSKEKCAITILNR